MVELNLTVAVSVVKQALLAGGTLLAIWIWWTFVRKGAV
jgi:hypothetical protein